MGSMLGALPNIIHDRRLWYRRTQSPLINGLLLGGTYAFVFAVAPWLLSKFRLSIGAYAWGNHTLNLLSVWGAAYFLFAATAASLASAALSDVIQNEILPGLSPAATVLVDQKLAQRFQTKRIAFNSTAIALVCTLASVWMLDRGNYLKHVSSLQLVWWSCGFFVLYLTAARVTDIARFYGVFAETLACNEHTTYLMCPSHSLQVDKTAAAGRIVLCFWIAITLSIVTLLPSTLFLKESERPITFAYVLAPVATFFSLGVGTSVFLRAERNIRRFVQSQVDAMLASLEKETNQLLRRHEHLLEVEWSKLRELQAFHKDLEDNGYYQSVATSGLSLLVPIATPVTALVSHWSEIMQFLKSLRFP